MTAALGIAFSPLPLLVVAALLGGPGTTRTAAVFVAGETRAIAAVAATGFDDESVRSTLAWIELAIAALLGVLLALHLLRRDGGVQAADVLRRLDRVRPGVAFLSGAVLVALNPKNLAPTLAGAAAIVDLDQSAGVDLVSVVVFTAIAASLLVVTVTAGVLAPARADALLGRACGALLRHERTAVTAVLGVLAVLFLVRGLAGLAS